MLLLCSACITGDQKEQQSTQSKFSPAEYQKKDVLSKKRLCLCAFEVLLPFSPWAFGNRPAASARIASISGFLSVFLPTHAVGSKRK
jgi:hypothetical protein